MPDISSVYINNTTYDIKDATARAAIAALGTVIKFKGTKATSSAITGLTSADAGDLWIVVGSGADNGEEWLCKETFSGGAQASKWEMLGTVTQTLGALAYKDSASGSYTPAGNVSVTLETDANAHAVTNRGTLPSFTRGTFSAGTLPSFTEGAFSAGSLPTWSASVTNEVLSFSFSAGTLPSKAADTFSAGTLPSHAADTFSAGTLPTLSDNKEVTGVQSATFTGTAGTITVS